jgi:uncharacterized protein with PIN domain
MSTATFTVHEALSSFLAREHRGVAIEHAYARAASMKQAIESLGVPHTEVGRIVVNQEPATLARTVRAGDTVEVFPHAPGEAPFEAPLAFVADAHMGGLARMLRMLGFDTAYDNAFDDPQIVKLAAEERRVVLTRDREMLKRRDVLRGCYVHALKPEAQLREVARRYAIAAHMQPFALCLHCNLPLEPAHSDAVAAQVPERIRNRFTRFMHCPGCDRVYWEGSHWQRMREVLAEALELQPSAI